MTSPVRDRGLIYVGFAVAAVAAWLLWLWLSLTTLDAPLAPGLLEDHFALPMTSAETEVLDRRAKLGDAFGPFNALVSTLAFGVLLITLHMQRKQLDQQREQFASEFRLIRQQQFQEQLFRAIDSYQQQLAAITVVHGTDKQTRVHTGRDALNIIVDEQLRKPLIESKEVGECVGWQLRPEANLVKWRETLAQRMRRSLDAMTSQPQRQAAVLDLIGNTWNAVYFRNRFQLDALFRAWYTVYRVLETASQYQIGDQQIWLYGATFRAQLSWVELMILLLNQSGLPGNTVHPTACRYSNNFCLFDNLSVEGDIVAALLRQVAVNRDMKERENALTNAAFFRPKRP